VTTVQEQGWAGIKNGELIAKIDDIYDVFIASDKNLRYQQNLVNRNIAIIELPTNRLKLLQQMTNKILDAITNSTPKTYIQLQETEDLLL
jgi:fructose-specific phosphotransferase system component IIB